MWAEVLKLSAHKFLQQYFHSFESYKTKANFFQFCGISNGNLECKYLKTEKCPDQLLTRTFQWINKKKVCPFSGALLCYN